MYRHQRLSIVANLCVSLMHGLLIRPVMRSITSTSMIYTFILVGIMGVLSSKCVLIGWVAPADELFRGEALLWTSVWVCEEVFDVHALAADHLHISSSKSKRPHLGFAVFPLLFHAMELSSQFSSTSPVLSSF